MKKWIILCLFLPAMATSSPGQAPVAVSGEASAILRDDIAKSVQVQSLIEEARINALQKITGTSLLLAEQLEVFHRELNEVEKSGRRYARSVNRFTGGLWITDIHDPVITEEVNAKGQNLMHVEVEGYAMTGSPSYASVRSSLSNCPAVDCETRLFTEGDPIYLKFEADKKGFLNVVLEDPLSDSAYVLQSENGFPLPVEEHTEFRIPDPHSENYYYELITSLNTSQINTRQNIWIVFTEDQSVIPIRHEKGKVQSLTVTEYRKWLYKAILQNNAVNVVYLPITVSPAIAHDSY